LASAAHNVIILSPADRCRLLRHGPRGGARDRHGPHVSLPRTRAGHALPTPDLVCRSARTLPQHVQPSFNNDPPTLHTCTRRPAHPRPGSGVDGVE
jgi:hypothetical protein